MTTDLEKSDWPIVGKLLWDDNEHILIAENVRTIDPIRPAREFSEQPTGQFCCANSFKPGTSRRKDNVARWHTWIVEFDEIPIDEQRKLLVNSGVPHTLRVFSGNKSLHTFIRVAEDVSPEEWAEIAEALKRSFPNADGKVLCDAARLCRTPNGMRDNGKRQAVEFVDHRIQIKDLKKWLATVTELTEEISAYSVYSGLLCNT